MTTPVASSDALADADRVYGQLLRFRRELRGFLRWSEETARANGLTPSVHQLLLAVRGSGREGGPTVKDVAEALDVRHHSAVELAQRAESADEARRGGLLPLYGLMAAEYDYRPVDVQTLPSGAFATHRGYRKWRGRVGREPHPTP